MKKILILSFSLAIGLCSFGQKYMTQNGTISFFSEAPIENIESTNGQVSSVVDMENGQLAFSLLMKAFIFEKALMQTHFNEKYVESEQFPKATFKGQIQDFENLELSKEPQDVTVSGSLTIHGVTQEVTSTGQMHFDADNHIVVQADMEIALEDYKVKIPASVTDNISETIAIKIRMNYEKLD